MGTNQTWNTTYETKPAASDNPGAGDNAIRNLKTTLSTRWAKEHYFPLTDNLGRQGIHKAGSAVPFIQSSEPSARQDGTNFETDIDEGRLWIDTDTGKMHYLKTIVEDPYTVTWGVVQLEAVGKIAAFAAPPDDEERWLPCDGQEITSTEESLDGEDGGYAALVTMLTAEVAGETAHPYYSAVANAVKVPDLRGVGLRGLDDYGTGTSDQGAANRDTADRFDNEDEVSTAGWSGSYQPDNIIDHRHEMDHTHGAAIFSQSGHETADADGRTGVPDWNAGDPNPGDESGNWDASDSELTEDGVLTMRDPDDRDTAGGVMSYYADAGNVTVDLQHYHTIPRFYGITRKLSEEAEDVTHGVPEPQDINYADEATMKNVAVYWFIKY